MRYRLTENKHGSWEIQRSNWGIFWKTIEIRTGLQRAVNWLEVHVGYHL